MIFSLSFTARKAADLSQLLCEREAGKASDVTAGGWILVHVGDWGVRACWGSRSEGCEQHINGSIWNGWCGRVYLESGGI